MKEKIAIQGELGSYSHLAATEIFSDVEIITCKTFDQALEIAKNNNNMKTVIPIENSIAGRVADVHYLLPKYKLKIIGEYWFGTDFPDLMRSLINTGNIMNKKIYTKELYEKFSKFIDDLQFVLDKNKVCSEVHMVFENKNF